MTNPWLKKLFPHSMAILVFVVLAVAYFYPQLQGKVTNSSDTVQFKAIVNEVSKFQKETGETALWTNSIFSGMPTTQISMPQNSNYVYKVKKLFYMGFDRPIGYFIAGMICFYIALISIGVSPLISAVGAILFGFTTGNISLFDTGHMTKIENLFFAPPMVAGFILILRNKLLKGGILFALFLSINIAANHPQMSYYLAMILGLGFMIHIGLSLKNKDIKPLGKQIGVLALGVVLAIGCSFSKLYTTYEYGKETMRGKPVLEKNEVAPESSSTTEGLSWEYATNWSNGYSDLFASYIPLVVGGSDTEILPDDSKFVRTLPATKGQPMTLYWGGLTSTAGPFYFGAIVFFLFLLGAITVKGKMKWILLSGVVLTLMISLGKNLSIFYRPIFDYLPMYNKFRTPNSVLAVTGIFVPMLAMLGLYFVTKIKNRDALIKPLLISAGSLIVIALGIILIGPGIFDFKGNYDANLGQYAGLMEETRESIMKSSCFRSIGLILISAGLIYAYSKEKLSTTLLVIIIGFLGYTDLMTINTRYLSHSDFVTKSSSANQYAMRPVDQQILQDTDPHYRVLDIPGFRSGMSSYHHKTIGGYHPVKLQRYQDLIDYHISQNNQQVLDMLNTKYIIYSQGNDGNLGVQRNTTADGNAWFVRNVQTVNSANEEIEKLSSVDPSFVAVVHNEFENYIGTSTFTGEGEIQLVSYTPNKIEYESTSSSEQMAVFSEIWYPHGWQAYIDGEKIDHIRVNYVLRGLNVPAGNHQITFEFSPQSYQIGETISGISSILVLLMSLLGIGWYVRNQNEELFSTESETKKEKEVAKSRKSIKARKKKK